MGFECTRAQLVDEASRELHWYLDEDDECFYIGEYTSRQGYGYSKINQAIYNLKIEPKVQHENPYRYQYKTQTIAAIGQCFRSNIKTEYLEQHATIIPIPPSKTRTHPDYDDRILQICNKIVADIANPDVQDIIVPNVDMAATHEQEHKPTPDELYAAYTIECQAAYRPRGITILVDDVLTTGSHFKACKRLINERFPETHVIGFFAARRVIANPFEAL